MQRTSVMAVIFSFKNLNNNVRYKNNIKCKPLQMVIVVISVINKSLLHPVLSSWQHIQVAVFIYLFYEHCTLAHCTERNNQIRHIYAS